MLILTISGSLRTISSNTSVLQAAAPLAPPESVIVLYKDLQNLPHFNPDWDGDDPPDIVKALRREVALADAMIICSPEYAHRVAGSMKNALDWLVGSCEFSWKARCAHQYIQSCGSFSGSVARNPDNNVGTLCGRGIHHFAARGEAPRCSRNRKRCRPVARDQSRDRRSD
jgi:NAD(P)H-dependent FMN reductase